jgi:hypothetical protein
LKAYIDQGVSYKDKKPNDALRVRAAAGNYDVDKAVWESLGLPIATTWEEMFGSINTSGKTIKLNLKGNKAKFTWQPCIRIYTKSRTGSTAHIATDKMYFDIVDACMEAAMRWPSAHTNNVGGQAEIQGVLGDIEIEILDQNGKAYVSGTPANNYDFSADKGSPSNLDIHLIPGDKWGTNWVPSVLFPGWNYNGNLKIEINFPLSLISDDPKKTAETKKELDTLKTMIKKGESDLQNNDWDDERKAREKDLIKRQRNKIAQLESLLKKAKDDISGHVRNISRIVEHEFGHVLGLFDAYGYGDKPRTPTIDYFFGEHGWIAGVSFPPAFIDGKEICQNSVMICDWQQKLLGQF